MNREPYLASNTVLLVIIQAVILLMLLVPTLVWGQTAAQADFDNSGVVDIDDFFEFALAFGTDQSKYDLDNDGTVDLDDFFAFALLFGEQVDCGNDVGNGLEIVSGPDGPEGADHDGAFRSLTVHPADPNIILMGTERNGFVKSIDGGTTWIRFREGLRHLNGGYPEIWDIAFDPVDPSNVYAATLDSPGPVTGDFPSAVGGVYKSTDGGNSWSRANCGLENSRITSIQVDPNSPNVLIIGIEGEKATFSSLQGQFFGGGIYRSEDRGDNWTRISVAQDDAKNGYWRMLALGDHFITFGFNICNTSENTGFLRSFDSGLTWVSVALSLKNLIITGFDASSDGQTIYANARDSFVIQISADGGANWTTTEINQANGPVAVSPSDSDLVLYAGSARLYRSHDGLRTTRQVLEAGGTITDIVFAPSDPTNVYTVADGYFFYKSTDSGATFSLVRNIRSDVLNN